MASRRTTDSLHYAGSLKRSALMLAISWRAASPGVDIGRRFLGREIVELRRGMPTIGHRHHVSGI